MNMFSTIQLQVVKKFQIRQVVIPATSIYDKSIFSTFNDQEAL